MNRLVTSKEGDMIIIALLVTSLLSVVHLSRYSQIFYLVGLVFGVTYYKIRVKQITRIKNVYTMLSMSSMFLLGATATTAVTPHLLPCYLLVCLYVLSISLLADIRDYYGDKQVGISSIPVVYGYGNAKKITAILLAAFLSAVLYLKLPVFYLSVPFIPLAAYLLYSEKIQRAYDSLVLSFLAMPLSAIAFAVM